MKENLPQCINKTSAWQNLSRVSDEAPNLKSAFESNPGRHSQFSVQTPHVYLDYSRQLVTTDVMNKLFQLATASGLRNKIDAMFGGQRINVTENRAVAHWALRMPSGMSAVVDGKDMGSEIHNVLQRIDKFSNEIHTNQRLGITGKKIRNIVSIGIGGSYLGPEYLAEACRPYAKEGMKLFFVANVDGADFEVKTKGLNPEETLFIIESKTFTTAETMKNANSAKRWALKGLSGKGSETEIIEKHFIAVSTAAEKVKAFGIDTENMFGFWDWVGGRYSATSAIGAAPLSLYLGYENFSQILKGARWMDHHYSTEPFEKNIPVINALIDIWNNNFLGYQTRALLPYSQLLLKLAQHVQQVEMESNGKRVDIYGRVVDFNTGEVVFGEPGTNGQHSFYQLLHQGQVIPADFIGFLNPSYKVGETTATELDHHKELLTNFLAQPDALAFGQKSEDPARVFEGNRPSSSLLLNELNPFTAGLLLSWLEHRAATKGFIWDINSFDQYGVELGKVLGVNARNAMLGNVDAVNSFNPSTKALFDAIMSGKLPS